MERFTISEERDKIQYRRPYFIFLVIDTIRVAIDIFTCILIITMTETMVKKFGETEDDWFVRVRIEVPKDAELTPSTLWFIRTFVLIAIFIQLGIIYIGWRGYNRIVFSPIVIYAFFRLLATIGLILTLFNLFNPVALIMLVISVISTVISFLFAFEVRKLRRSVY